MAYRIDNATASVSLPTPAAVGPNPNGYFTKGNPSLGIPATVLDDDWANAFQEEVCNVIEGAGLTLSKTTRNQLLQAIEILNQKDIGIYTTSSTAANTYTATMSPVPAAYTEGMFVAIKFTHGNTGAATINLNSLGAVAIHYLDGTALKSGAFADGQIALLMHDGTYFQLINPVIVPANYLTIANYQNNTPGYVADSGSANAYAATLSPAITAYTAGLRLSVKIANTNTSQTCTLNVNGLGTKTIVPANTGGLTIIFPGNMQSAQICHFVYDGTNFQLQNPYIDQDALKLPNLIYGGDFNANPWQRNNSFTSVANGANTADRFKWAQSGSGVVNIALTSDNPTVAQCGNYGNTGCLAITITTADSSISSSDTYSLRYTMEGLDFTRIAQRYFTLSFWVKAFKAGTYCVGLRNSGNDRSYIAEYTINNSATWEYKTILVPASPSSGTWLYTNGAGLQIDFVLACGSTLQTTAGSWASGNFIASSNQVNGMDSTSNYFYLNYIQVEPGLNATAFKFRGYQQEWALCQRYYEKSMDMQQFPGAVGSNGVASGQMITTTVSCATFGGNRFKVTKRTDPTMQWYSDVTGAAGNVRLSSGADSSVSSAGGYVGVSGTGYPVLNSTAASGTFISAQWTADAEF